MLTCRRRRRRRRRRHRLQGDATPRTLVGVSEAQKKRSSEAPFGQTEGQSTKDQTSGFFVSFVRDFRNFSHQPPLPLRSPKLHSSLPST